MDAVPDSMMKNIVPLLESFIAARCFLGLGAGGSGVGDGISLRNVERLNVHLNHEETIEFSCFSSKKEVSRHALFLKAAPNVRVAFFSLHLRRMKFFFASVLRTKGEAALDRISGPSRGIQVHRPRQADRR